MRAPFVGAACVLAMVACGAFEAASDDPGTTDGGSPSSSKDDGGTLGDAATSDGGLTFCQTNAGPETTFCEDFDRGQPPRYGFPSASPNFVFTPAPGHASPTAMQLTAGLANQGEQDLGWQYTGNAPKFLSVRFQVEIHKVPNGLSTDAVLARFRCSSKDSPDYIAMKLRPNGNLKLQVGANDDTDDAPMPLDTWTEVSFTWDIAAAKYHATGGSRLLEIASGADVCPAPVDVLLGFSNWADPPSADYQVAFDDVQIEFH